MAQPSPTLAAFWLLSLFTILSPAAILPVNFSEISKSAPNRNAIGFLPANNSTTSLSNLSASNDEYDDCFDPRASRRGLYPTNIRDCFNAARYIVQHIEPFRPVSFARRQGVGFKLPRVVRSKTCVISIDVMQDDEEDVFVPLLVFSAATDLASRCTQGMFDLGGRTTVGPRKVVNVVILGRFWAPADEGLEPTVSEVPLSISEAPTVKDMEGLSESPPPNITGESRANTTSLDQDLQSDLSSLISNARIATDASNFGGIAECNDPPLPRERAWPVGFKDCKRAIQEIVGSRERRQEYIFSRKALGTRYWYPLPAKFTHNSCVILLDMKNDGDQDTVRLSSVEASAWNLAHKCSGLEVGDEEYGGRMTVSVGGKDLIVINIYGNRWRSLAGGSNVTALAESRFPSLLDSE